jgi:hypothetical protein
MKSVAVTVGTTPTLLVAADDKYRKVYIHVTDNNTVYLGNSSVTTSTGLETEKHTTPIEFEVPSKETIYAVVVSGTVNVRVMTPDVD